MTDTAIENLKHETAAFYSETDQSFFSDRIEKFKIEIVEDFKRFKESNPDKSFEQFRSLAYKELQTAGLDGNPLMKTLGIYLNAFDAVDLSELQ